MATNKPISWISDEISSLGLRKKSTISLEHVPFAVLYAYTLYECYRTFGQPYLTALEKAEAEDTGVCDTIEFVVMRCSFVSRLMLGTVIVLHGLMLLMQHWSIDFRCWLKYPAADIKDATFVKIRPLAHKGKAALVPLQRSKHGAIFFEFQKYKLVYSPLKRCFSKVDNPDHLPLGEYTTTGLSDEDAALALERHGANQFEITLPSFGELYLEGMLSPFTVFQMFCILLWCMDEYWQYSLFTAFMMLVFEGTVVMSRRKNLQTLRGMNNEPRKVQVLREGQWRTITARQLVPGDVVSLTKDAGMDGDVIPCDCLLLRGAAVVNEATLTGESVPQMKEAVPMDDVSRGVVLDIRSEHKVHVLFGGTRLLQCTAADSKTAGCLCYVIRTGFDSSQGQMVRMIEFSSEKVSGNTTEALLLVLFLLIFALSARRGLEEGREQFDLLLHCVLIITSVIPPELNMQLALAVNASLLTLLRLHIFCTEPFRIPMAGKIDVCLFDKTGTLTTDELVAAGSIAWPLAPKDSAPKDSAQGDLGLVPISDLPLESAIVVAGCHSLVAINGETNGDPLELTALKALQWQYDANANIAQPAPGSKHKSAKCEVSIRLRQHFSSKLQRMCTIAKVHVNDKPGRLWVLVKGSAEVVGTLLAEGPTQPSRTWYDTTHRHLARQGLRVIALAYAEVPTSISETELVELPREEYEKNLRFGGFIAFRCLLRKDSAKAIIGLQESSHQTAMITGDALLTGIHVASEVSMVSKERTASLAERGAELVWVAPSDAVIAPFAADQVPALAAQHDLCVTGALLSKAVESSPELWKHVHHIKVFARMTPDLKERVIVAMKDNGHSPLMCGDGANDVGALKQAHVGIALLSGFGSANAASVNSDKAKEKEKEKAKAEALKSATALTAQAVQRDPREVKAEQAAKNKAKQEEFVRNVAERKARGESFAEFKEMMAMSKREAEERRKAIQKQGNIASSAAALLETEDGSIPMVKLGDASAAAPFTVKLPSIASALDIIRQGRCTLVTSLQMYQILALNCLISSYSLSILYLDGVKNGDKQMTVLGILITMSYLSLSRATPLEKLSPVRPLTTIFHPAMFLSLLGQFATHLYCMSSTVALAKPHLPPTWTPNPDGKFEPNLINSVVFLMTCIQQVTVFAVNYKGPPFMNGLAKNNLLLGALASVAVGAAAASANLLPVLNSWLQLVEYPSQEFRSTFFKIIVLNVAGVFLIDRLCVAIFAPKLLIADIKGTSFQDVKKIIKVIGFVTIGLMFLAVEPPPEEVVATVASA